ncbi:hypothetical protein J891_4129, partial [Acinetobacter baumannii 44327_8]
MGLKQVEIIQKLSTLIESLCMKQHQYHVTVQHLKDAKGEVSTYTERLEFYTG